MKKTLFILLACLFTSTAWTQTIWNAKNAKQLEFAIASGGNVNEVDAETGFTPLMTAVILKKYDMAVVLLDNGANLELKDKDGYTTLTHSVIMKNHKMGKLLLDRGANINTRDNKGKTPMHWAVLAEVKKPFLELLLNHKPDLSLQDYEYELTALEFATQLKMKKTIKTLQASR